MRPSTFITGAQVEKNYRASALPTELPILSTTLFMSLSRYIRAAQRNREKRKEKEQRRRFSLRTAVIVPTSRDSDDRIRFTFLASHD